MGAATAVGYDRVPAIELLDLPPEVIGECNNLARPTNREVVDDSLEFGANSRRWCEMVRTRNELPVPLNGVAKLVEVVAVQEGVFQILVHEPEQRAVDEDDVGGPPGPRGKAKSKGTLKDS